MRLEVATELVGDLPHERDLVAEAFRCCHDVTPSMRVSAPVTLPKPSDTPAHKPYKARASPASGAPDPGAMPGMQVRGHHTDQRRRLFGSPRLPGSNLRREHPDHQRSPSEFTGVPIRAGPASNERRPTPHAQRRSRIRCSRAASTEATWSTVPPPAPIDPNDYLIGRV